MAITKKDLAVLKVALRMEAAQFKKESKKTRTELKGLSASFKKMGRDIKASAAGLIAATASIAGLRRAWSSMLDTMDKTEAVSRFADRIGASSEFVSALEYHFTSAGASAEQVNTVLQRLTKRLGQAQMGSNEAQKAFAGLGLQWEELAGMNTEQALFRVLKAMQSVEEGAQQVARAVGLGDTEIGALLSGIQELPPALQDVIDKAESLGAVITEDMGDSAREFNQTIKDLTTSWEGLVRAIVNSIGGELNEFVEGLRYLARFMADDTSGMGLTGIGQLRVQRQDALEALEKQRDVLKETQEFRNMFGAGFQQSYIDAETEKLRILQAEFDKLDKQLKQQEEKRKRDTALRYKQELEAMDAREEALKEELRLMDLRARASTREDRRIAEARMREVDREEDRKEAEDLRDKFSENLEKLLSRAPATQGVGAVRKGTVAGFSAVQAGFRAQQQQTFMDRERNRLLDEMNRELKRLGEEPITTVRI